MTRTTLFIVLAATVLFNSACTHYFYAPNTLQTPFLQEQHDTRVSAGLISGDEFSGYELSAVYSPVKYGAVLVNHFQVNSGQQKSDPGAEWGKGHLSEIAIGGYYPVGKYASFSLFTGWGAGSVFNRYDVDVRADLHFQRQFIQPAVSIQGKWARFGAALRFNRLRFVRGDVDVEVGEPDLTTIENIERASPVFVPEAGLSCGFGYRPFWADFHLNFCNIKRREDYGFAYSTVGVTFTLELDRLWRTPAPNEPER